ncbi:PAS domain-containing protein [Massilia sp. G4R7]|uniref:PAS domain-containing protein n=1 Tax=Massilia phyllostachyos TaxID=2898585 RepID=A0ABS8QEG5_9BURK|nr:PAS domain-containing protein [Massilia phyllostachyos]MCD2519556.1 PAS domain-containing protein [Massilia phyllostachyos]
MKQFDDIAHWRIRIFSRLMTTTLLLGTATAIPSALLALADGLAGIAVLDAVALAWIFAIWCLDRLPYTLRMLNFLVVLYVVGIGLMLTVGSISQIYLVGPPVMAVILLGTRQALAILVFTALSIFALGASGKAELVVMGLGAQPLLAASAVCINFLCVGAIITLTCGTLIKGLTATLDEMQGVAASLEAKQDELRAADGELRLTAAAVARLNDMVLIARAVDLPGAEQPIIFANDAFLRRTGYAREEVIGRSMGLLHGPDTDPDEVARTLAAVADNRAVRAELVNYTKDGDPYWVEMELVPFFQTYAKLPDTT